MGKIQKLPDLIINQIAAGEVVERPVSVVKELVENALDVGPSQIDIYVEEGGKSLIRVIDNGAGITKDDLPSTLERHWTSKIHGMDDLQNISSFGFRGEALASIASVSKLKIRSRTKDAESGWELRLGELLPIEVGMSKGTEIEVRDLFYNLSARQKFLKSDSTEYGLIAEFVYQEAFIWSDVSFRLYKNGKKVFHSLPTESVKVLNALVGEELASRMVKIEGKHPQMRVSGWIGRPGTGATRQPKQHVFVNNRVVDDRLIWSAVRDGYGSLLGRGEKPQFVIRVDITPHLIDVNVHPQKREVKFLVGSTVFQVVRGAVAQGLQTSGAKVENGMTVVPLGFNGNQNWSDSRSIQTRIDMGYRTTTDFSASNWGAGGGVSFAGVADEIRQDQIVTPNKMMQVHDLFIIEESVDGMNVYDQHAVHERILYERFVQDYLDAGSERNQQPLLIPLELELTANQVALWDESSNLFEKLGFGVVREGDRLIIKSVPSVLAGTSLTQVFFEYLGDLAEGPEVEDSDLKNVDNQTHRRLAYLACRSAIKAGDKLNLIEMQDLLVQYHQTKTNATCPHGRPVRAFFSKEEMRKWFRR